MSTLPEQTELRDFDVELCRTGVGFATISVAAIDEFEAQQLALDRAGELDYNEKSSEYTLCFPALTAAEKASMSRPPMELIFELEAVDRDRTSTVGGACINVTHDLLQRFQSLTGMANSCNLSEVRFYSEPANWLGCRVKDAGLASTEFVLGKSWIGIAGQDHLVDGEVKSMGVELATLLSAFDEGVERVVVLQGSARSDDLSFIEDAGLFDDLQSIENLRVLSPFELVSQDALQAAFDDYRGVLPRPRD